MTFEERIYQLISQIPRGQVTSYGALAAAASTPRAARVVGSLLRALPRSSTLPWYRVVNAHGMISIENLAIPKAEQARRLQAEGVWVELKDGNYWVDFRKHFWTPSSSPPIREANRGRKSGGRN